MGGISSLALTATETLPNHPCSMYRENYKPDTTQGGDDTIQ